MSLTRQLQMRLMYDHLFNDDCIVASIPWYTYKLSDFKSSAIAVMSKVLIAIKVNSNNFFQ